MDEIEIFLKKIEKGEDTDSDDISACSSTEADYTPTILDYDEAPINRGISEVAYEPKKHHTFKTSKSYDYTISSDYLKPQK